MTTILLISSPTEERLLKATRGYFCDSTLQFVGDAWPKLVYNSRGMKEGLEVHIVRLNGQERYHLRKRLPIEKKKEAQ